MKNDAFNEPEDVSANSIGSRSTMVPTIPLFARAERVGPGAETNATSSQPIVARVCTNPDLPIPLRSKEILLLDADFVQRSARGSIDTTGFRGVFVRHAVVTGGTLPAGWMTLPPDLAYLQSEDIINHDPRSGGIRVMYRRASHSNFLLLTERCNSKCLMCSQPPRKIDDGYLVDELLAAIPLISPATETLGFTGGETTLLHDRFIDLIRTASNYLPETRLDVLTNGRLMSYLRYAQQVAAVRHPNLILCIPLYSDVDSLHDFVVQAKGAFDQTIRGILNLGRVGVAVEIRIVIHKQTYARLPQIAEFIARNLPFVSHVALMGLEMMGFTRANLEALWIDPVEYQEELAGAVETLDWAGIPASIYNHQLCLLPEKIRPWSRQSISDWKNMYMPECDACSMKADCGGFFASAPLRYSRHITPL